MLEPFTALSLATAIVAFVDFGGKLVKTGYSSYKSAQGTTEGNVRLEEVTKDLALINQQLADSLRANEGPLTHDDHRLQEMGDGCRRQAEKLLELLDGLRVKGGGTWRSWRALRKSIEERMKRSEIDEMVGQLNMYRQQISAHLLAIMRNNQTTTLEELRRLDESNRRLHQTSLDELQRLKRDLLSSLQSHGQLVDRYKFWASSSSTDRAHERDLLHAINENMQALRKQAAPLATEFRILDSLYFEQMHTRHAIIKPSYADTFAWIFDDDTTHFKSWLRRDSGLFWVRGKAGSGKSTLMKFLSDHSQTPAILEQWAGAKRLVTASFYFWNAGSAMEKSHEGLLQSLLFQILRQCPELIPTATPHRWQGNNAYHDHPRPWSGEELSHALKAALSGSVLPARFCFFIDGLDEFAGDYADLALAGSSQNSHPDHQVLLAALHSLAHSDDVKICVSSRPWNPFRNAFGDDKHRMFVLEDLTKKDMDVYVQGMLEEDSRFRRLAQGDPQAMDLVVEIREKAQGVFLWVFLAVRSLLRGLSEDDTVAELQKRLRSLPSDLKLFFHRILASIDEEYRPLTCRMLIMTDFASSRLPLLAFWFLRLELDCPEYAIRAKIEPLGPAAAKLKGSATSSINKWCRDLLEVEFGAHGQNEEFRLLNGSIGFLHRTVKDFLADPDVSSHLFSHAGADFDARTSCMRLFLAQAKLLPSQRQNRGRFDGKSVRLENCAERIMFMAKELECRGGGPATTMLKELDRVGQYNLDRKGSHWVEQLLPVTSISYNYESFRMDDHGVASFLSHAVCYDLTEFVRVELASHPGAINKTGRPLLEYVLHPTSRSRGGASAQELEDDISVEMLEILFSAGADPNANARLSGSHTVWQIFLYECYHGRPGNLRSTALAFLRHGADSSCKVPIALSKHSLAPIGNLSGSKHTRIDPSRGSFVDKEFATVEECLSKVLTVQEIAEASAGWRPRSNPSSLAAMQKPRGWLSWLPW